MRILDLTASTGTGMSAFGSSGTTVAPLATGPTTNLTCLRLEAGGRIGRHDAGAPLLFALTTGNATVTGADGTSTDITAGQTVLWDAGEAHDTHTTTGCTFLADDGAHLVGDDLRSLRSP
jgi:quercetin dioxygenase-like cupin family protein